MVRDAPPPPPAALDDGAPAVAPDVLAVAAVVRLDPSRREATGSAVVDLVVGDVAGRPALDLRQPLERVVLDGEDLGPARFPTRDLGGGDGAGMRVLDRVLGPGTAHRLELGWVIGEPDARGAVPVDWRGDGVRWDLWMSDLAPGRYLESWIPAPLCHDRLALTVDVELPGAGRPHVVVANGEVTPTDRGWRVAYPAHFTSLSPMLVLAPADEVERRRRQVPLPGRHPLELGTWRHVDVDADLAACEADVAAWLPYLDARYGPWSHGGAMEVVVWGPGRGMEYDGATTASVGALEHEVFHSWFGRGVKPASAGDGWIDEAWTSWATSTRRSEVPRFVAEPPGPDLAPTVLRPPSPWARHTPVEAYTVGARVFAAVADRIGGADRLRSAMAAWYAANAGGFDSTDGLLAHLQRWSGADLADLWDRYVHGRG